MSRTSQTKVVEHGLNTIYENLRLLAESREAAAQINILWFCADFIKTDKVIPLMQLAQKKKRGEAAKKMQNPLWEQGVGSLDIPRGFPMGIFRLRRGKLHEGEAEVRRRRL
jgi:hypothetical protein